MAQNLMPFFGDQIRMPDQSERAMLDVDNFRRCCDLRRELAEAFANAARQYSEAAVRLVTLGSSEVNYARLSQLALEAQRRSEEAFALYREHVVSHRCVARMEEAAEQARTA